MFSYCRYPGLNMMWLVDFEGKIMKPEFLGKEGYHKRDPKGPFRISESDIRELIQVNISPYCAFKSCHVCFRVSKEIIVSTYISSM